MARSKSSKRWLTEHFDDPYVKLAQQQGMRSRSAFKLLELQDKYQLIKAGMTVVDLGAAPGGWCQLAQSLVGEEGRVVGLDILFMDPLHGVQFIQGDFTDDEPLRELLEALDGQAVDLVLSDMAPNISGNRSVDQPRAMYLAELAADLSSQVLKPGGCMVLKLFHGEGFDDFVRSVRQRFGRVRVRKPAASRTQSRETYMVATDFRV